MLKTSHSGRTFKAVLFDLDDTLHDRGGAYVRLCRHWYRTLPSGGRPAGEDQFAAGMAEWDQGGLAKHAAYAKLLRLWPGCFPDVESAIASHRRLLADFVTFDPRARALLVRVRRAGMRSAVVTNGTTASQRTKLHNMGIDSLVDAIVVSEFQRALGAIGAQPAETLFVGDNPVADICGAQQLGMLTAWVHLGRDWELDAPRPDYVIGGEPAMRW